MASQDDDQVQGVQPIEGVRVWVSPAEDDDQIWVVQEEAGKPIEVRVHPSNPSKAVQLWVRAADLTDEVRLWVRPAE